MKTSLLSLALATILAGCGSMQQPTTSSGADASTCQTIRGMMGRGNDAVAQESCVRQLGAEGCKQCLAGK